MRLLKRLTRFALRLFAYGAGATLVLCLLAILVGGFTGVGGSFVASQLASMLSTPDQRISIDGAGPLLDGKLRIDNVTLADSQGTYGEIRGLAMDWSPLDLLSGRLTAERIAANSVRIQRAPVAAEQDVVKDGSGFSLPIEIDVRSLDLPVVDLGQGLAGRDIRLSLSGSGQAVSDRIAAQLRATRAEVPEAGATADLVYAPAENRLRLTGELNEPANGLLAGLLRLPGSPALRLGIDGDGPLSDWTGKVTAEVDGRPTLTVEATHRIAAGLRSITATGGGRFDALLPPTLRPPFEGETVIDLAASLDRNGAVTIERGRLSTAALDLIASGRYTANGTNDLKARLVSKAGPVPINWTSGNQTIAATVEQIALAVSGPASSTAIDLTGRFASLELAQGTLSGVDLAASSDTFDLATLTGPLRATLSVAASQLADTELDRILKAPLTIKAPLVISATRLGFDGATIESTTIGGKLSGEYALNEEALTGRFELFAVPGVLPENLASKFEGTIGLAGTLEYALPRDLRLSDLRVTTSLGEATGSVSLGAENELKADLAGRISNLAALVDNISGSAEFALFAEGPLDALAVKLSLKSEAAVAAGRKLENLSVEIDGTADRSVPKGTLKMSGTLDGQPIEGAADLVSKDGRSEIPALAVTVGANRIEGALRFSPAFAPSGTLSFDLPEIGLIAALAGQDASGDLKGSVDLTESGGKLSAKIVATGSTLTRDTLTIAAPDISLAISDLATFAAEGSVSASTVSIGANRIETPELAFSRQGSNTAFNLDGRYDGAPLLAEGRIQQQEPGLRITLDALSATPRRIPLKLARPAAFAVVGGNVTIETAVISAGSGTVDITGNVGETLDLNAVLRNVPASLVATVAPSLAPEGAISGTITAKGTPAAPVVDYALDWANAAVAQTRGAGVGAFSLSAKGEFSDGRLSLDTQATGEAGLGLSGGGTISLSGERPIAMNFTGNLPFAALTGLLSRQGLVLEGSADANVSVSGGLGAPQITGTVRTSGARLIDVRRNLAIEQLAATATLEGNRASVTGLTGKLASGGTISGGGTIDILSPGMPADIAITLDKAVYVDGTMMASTADGQLTLKGPLLTAPLLAGRVDLTETAITIPEKLPTSLAELDIQHRNAPPAVRRQMATITKTERHGSQSSINLDLIVSSPTQIFVRGRGIDAELGGTIAVSGTAQAPNVSGAFDLRRGRLSILTKRMQFTNGTITFGGGLIPILDMEATTTSGTTTIIIKIAGFANDPTVSFSSSPSLPQDEILAQLIFGQSMARLSPLQIAQLADAAAQLAGGRSTSLFEALRSTLGVDDLDISTDETGQAKVSAGKYLNDRTYIELQQGGAGETKAVINLDIGRGVKLKGEAGAEGAGAGIFYEKEY